MPKPIGLFYGSSTCYTEIAAEKIAELIGDERVAVHNLLDDSVSLMADYDFLILGIPTWDYGELQEDWENCWDDLASIDFHGKVVAIYGLGDQLGYPEWFQDAMGYLCRHAESLGAKTIGRWPTTGYTFTNSQALTEDGAHFVGLALDEDSQFELSESRLALWCEQIVDEFDVNQGH
ncbi:MAG: flavodoxin FldB [bacterium]